jgi:stage II sporulation protein D
MSRGIVGLGVAILWLCAMAGVALADAGSIRVALAQEAQRVKLAAEGGLVLSFQASPGQAIITGPVEVSPVAGELAVNGLRRSGPLLIRGRNSDLTVAIAENGLTDALRQDLVVTGTIQVLPRGKGLLVVNEVDLEEYVKGVVPSEMSPSWHLEALKAQAVAARSYALYQRMMNAGREYDLMAGTQDQVYRGRNRVEQRVQEAVEATRGLVLTHRNAPILAAFSSTAAGPTEDAINVWSKDLPYLKGVDCPFDANSPYYQWRVAIKLQELEASLKRSGMVVGTIASVTPFTFSRAGRVTALRILHSQGELILRGEELRRAVGYTTIPSALFEVESVGREVVLVGRGAGHGVGLCQWGAKELAELGYPFGSILQYYFPGTQLQERRLTESLPPS